MDSFTPAQLEAINTNAEEILVSAAAGSGKTAVLTQRIIRHITQGVSLDRLLIVTFTEAASAEMRERIEKGLHENGLYTQSALLPVADISTIHSFCRKLIRENFQQIDIDPAFKIGDDAELSLIKSQTLDQIFETEYQEGNADFIDLADVYGGKTTDGRLESLILGIYEFIQSDPFPKEAARRYALAFEGLGDIDGTSWAKIAREELIFGVESAYDSICRASTLAPEKYIDKLSDEKKMLSDLLQLCRKLTFGELYTEFSQISWGTLPRITAKDEVAPEEKERVQRIRNKAKDRVKKLVKGVFFAPPQKILSDLQALAPRVNALIRLTLRFYDEYAAEKRAKNIMDFSDLEHFAIQILYPNAPEDMSPAEDIHKYYEVLIDEYQDSNEIQDLILSAVAERRFLVGDVKQSIYRFRRANPELFLKKYREGKNCIHLSHNFRSRPEVLRAINFFFEQLMCTAVGDVEYDDNAALHAGHESYEAKPTSKMQIEVAEYFEDSEDEEAGSKVLSATTPHADQSEPIGKIIAETRVIAKCIKELSDEYQFGDIAILSRSISNISNEVIRELKKHGIDAIADKNEDFFERQEIKVMTAFLRIIDNPRQDIELITVLCSPVYEITADELFQIASVSDPSRQAEQREKPRMQESDFYERAMLALSQDIPQALCAKLEKFFADLEKWRSASVYMPISRLVGLVYDSTRYPAHVGGRADGAVAQANLRLLFERAIEFENTSMKGLFHFVRYIERLSAAGIVSSAEEPNTSGGNRVRLMSIHKSKGLEFPVVICAFLAKKFNTEDLRRPVILHSREGVGAYYVDTRLRTRANTLARFGLQRLTHRENMSEEMRCLYVALTRAKERLILTGTVKDYGKAMEKWSDSVATDGQRTLPRSERQSAGSYLDWLMPCVICREGEARGIFEIRVHGGWGEDFQGAGEAVTERGDSREASEAVAEIGALLENSQEAIGAVAVRGDSQEAREAVTELGALFGDSQEASEARRGALLGDSQGASEAVTERGDFQGASEAELGALRGDSQEASELGVGRGVEISQKIEKIQLTPQKAAPALPSKLSISEIKRLYDITPDSSFINANEVQLPTFEPPQFIAATSGITAAKIGSALHKITEHIDFSEHTSIEKIKEFIAFLREKNHITAEESQIIEPEKIKTLTSSPLAQRIRNAAAGRRLFRETPFVLALPAAELYPSEGVGGSEGEGGSESKGEEASESKSERASKSEGKGASEGGSEETSETETILVHGIIDCHFEENGKIVLIDFKSDNIPPTVTTKDWAKKHYVQLKIYKQALEKATGMEVSEVLLYSFARDEVVQVYF